MTRWQTLKRTPGVKQAIFCVGWLLMILAPIASPLPGPGGTIMFVAGLTLLLETSPWAKRRYVKFKRRWPRAGGWLDWGLRRQSAKRRLEREKRALAGAPIEARG